MLWNNNGDIHKQHAKQRNQSRWNQSGVHHLSTPAPLPNSIVKCFREIPRKRSSWSQDLCIWNAGMLTPSPPIYTVRFLWWELVRNFRKFGISACFGSHNLFIFLCKWGRNIFFRWSPEKGIGWSPLLVFRVTDIGNICMVLNIIQLYRVAAGCSAEGSVDQTW